MIKGEFQERFDEWVAGRIPAYFYDSERDQDGLLIEALLSQAFIAGAKAGEEFNLDLINKTSQLMDGDPPPMPTDEEYRNIPFPRIKGEQE